MKELDADVLIVGGGLGACSAALSVAEAGHSVVMTEETDWIGGQLTSQAVPPDEHGWIEEFGCTSSYRRLRNRVRQYYQDFYPLTASARASKYLNPGRGWVSPLCHEPRVALAALESMLAPFVSSGRLRILRKHRVSGVEGIPGDRLGAVHLYAEETGKTKTVSARYFLDATEMGDVLPLSATEYVTGRESNSQTGEPTALSIAQPGNVQAFTVCLAVDHLEGEDHTIDRPARYEFWRSFVPNLNPSWPGPLFSWTTLNPRTMDPMHWRFDPNREEPKAFAGLWSYRRILNRTLFTAGTIPSDICLVNWPMIDYWLGDILSGTAEDRLHHIEEARQLSLSLVYWLQTEAPRPDGGRGWPGLRLRGDVMGTENGLAKYPYVRESRRIKAEFTVCEQHVAVSARSGECRAEHFDDSVGIGYYRIDLHPSTGNDNFIDVASLPFQIPLGSLIPIRVENLIPAAKNIGTTHITNGCYRLHPIEWNIGEAAGNLAVFCVERKCPPRAVYKSLPLRREFQNRLVACGIELEWPADLNLEEGDPHAHMR